MNPESTPYATYYELKTAALNYIGALIICKKKCDMNRFYCADKIVFQFCIAMIFAFDFTRAASF